MNTKEKENLNMVLNMSVSQILDMFLNSRSEHIELTTAIYSRLKIEITTSFKLTVNYNLASKNIIRAGHYDNEEYIFSNSWYLPITKYKLAEKISNKKEVVGQLFNYTASELTITEVISQMEKAGFYPANILELLTFGVQYPEIQRVINVISIQSVLESHELGPFLACLYGNKYSRELSFKLFSRENGFCWNTSGHFKDYALGIKQK
ncbi:MAG: hypothetical protein PHH83_02955 [Patescibacteria group bacterium]|nr:hypothetical protein [Patescibacteria group bacterium]